MGRGCYVKEGVVGDGGGVGVVGGGGGDVMRAIPRPPPV